MDKKIFTVITLNSTYTVVSDADGKRVTHVDTPDPRPVHARILIDNEVFQGPVVGDMMCGGSDRPWHTSTVLEVLG